MSHPSEPLADPRGFLRRMAANWSNFFFKPSDPSTLGLMRIFAGLFALYLHLAYSNDLMMFFGRDGIVDTRLANTMRQEVPYLPHPMDWDLPRPTLTPPLEFGRRREFFAWLQDRLPNTVDGRRHTLKYLIELPDDEEGAIQGLTFVDRLSPKADERDRQLAKLVQLPVDDVERNRLIPPHLQKPNEADRKIVRDDVQRLLDTFATESQKQAVIGHLIDQTRYRLPRTKRTDAADERMRTIFYLAGGSNPEELQRVSPLDPKERADVLAYMQRWNVDKRQNYAQGNYTWSIFYHVTDPLAMKVIHVGILVVMALFTLGFCTRLTSALTWIGMLMYTNRSSQVLFGMDAMMSISLFYLTLGPSGAALSVDRLIERWRAAREIQRRRARGEPTGDLDKILAGPRPMASATFVTRMIQIHFCFIYLASGFSKLKGNAWWDHTALWGTLYNPEFAPTVFAPYRWLMKQLASVRPLWALFMSGGVIYTLGLEIGLPFLIWRPRLRPYLVVAAVLLHTGIAVFMGLTIFGLFMMVLLMAYIPPWTVRRWLGQNRETLPKLEFRYSPADPEQARKVLKVKALDVWNQVEYVELSKPDGPARLTKRDGDGKPISLMGLGLFRPLVFKS